MVWYILNIYKTVKNKNLRRNLFQKSNRYHTKMKYVDNIYTLKNHNINPSNNTAKKKLGYVLPANVTLISWQP